MKLGTDDKTSPSENLNYFTNWVNEIKLLWERMYVSGQRFQIDFSRTLAVKLQELVPMILFRNKQTYHPTAEASYAYN